MAPKVSQLGAGMVTADEISWRLAPIARIEDIEPDCLLALDPIDLLFYAQCCREDLRALRVLLAEALMRVASQKDQLTRAARVVERQRQQMATMREAA